MFMIDLAGDVEVEPGRVGGLEHAEVARDHGAQRDQDAPSDGVQHSVELWMNGMCTWLVRVGEIN